MLDTVVIKKTGKKTLMGAITGNEDGEADGEGGKEEADGRSKSSSVDGADGADKKPVV